MSSLPRPSVLSMPPLERSHTDLLAPSYMSSPSNRPYHDPVHHQYAYHSRQDDQSGHHFASPSLPYSSPQMTYRPYPSQQSPFQVSQPDFSYIFQSYSTSPVLPTMAPRYSGSGAGAMGIPGRNCAAPQDLFRLPSAQSLPSNLIGLGMYVNEPVSGLVEEGQVSLEEVLGNDDDEAEPAIISSPESSSAESIVDIEEQDEEEEAPEFQSRPSVTKPKKRRSKGPTKRDTDTISQIKSKLDITGKDESREGKKRSRTSQACEKCRMRKARCFGGDPCDRCIKKKITCTFTPTASRARRHSMSTVNLATTAPSLIPPSPVLPQTQASTRPGRPPVHNRSHSHALPIPSHNYSAVHPALRPNASEYNTQATFLSPFSLPRSIQSNSLGVDFASASALNSNPSFGPAFAHPIDRRSYTSSPNLEIDSDADMPELSNTFSASGSSGPASNSGHSVSPGGWRSHQAYHQINTIITTPMLVEDGHVQLSPFQDPESAQLDWGVADTSSSLGGVGMSANPSSSFQGFPTEDLDRTLFADGGVEWYNQGMELMF